jgi:hypothetical protein
LTNAELTDWIERYERAWRTPGVAGLGDLFTANATYSPAPFDPSLHGLDEIAAFWDSERESAEELFELTWEPVAYADAVGVARVEVQYAGPPQRTYRDLWIITLDDGGLCRAFEEWPFFPGQPRTASNAQASR